MLFVASNTFAQLAKDKLPKPGVISGKIIDNTSKEPLPYVNIVIRDMAKAVITGGITTDAGSFEIKDIPEGKSIVEIQFIGYKTISKEISITNKAKQLNLGTIVLTEDAAKLDEVVVRAELSTVVQKVDRKVINVGKDLTATGTSASELLNNVQSVSVDSQTGAISLRGNENVRVLVDGRPTNISAAQLLKQIPSTSIKSIELITNPSAKYNPEGMSGIINIILNKNANMGFNGNIDVGVTAGHYGRTNASTNMNLKTGKVNFFLNYGYNGGDNYNYGFVERTDANASLQNFTFMNNNQSHLLKLGADIYLDDQNTLSFYTTQNWFDGLGNGFVKISNNNVLFFDAKNTQETNNKNNVYNVNYKHDFAKEGKTIEFEATFSDNKAPENAIFTESINPLDNTLNYLNDVDNHRTNTLLNVDFTNPLSDKTKLELGAEVRLDRTTNDIITDQFGVPNSAFDYDRDIYSAYVNYSRSFDKLSMQLGARIENYSIVGSFTSGTQNEKVTDDIFTVYPSAFFTYKASDKNQFQVSYSRRVDRPSIQQVNPIREWSTPLITSVGNPDLVPQFTNSFEVNYTRKLKKGSLTFGTFYRRVNDNISRTLLADPLDNSNTRQILSFTNFNGNDRYGFELSSNYKLAKWWSVNASSDFYAQTENGIANGEQIEVDNNVFNARVSNSFTASKKLRLQLFAMYRGSQKGVQFNVDPMWMINTGASYSMFEGKGSLNFRVNDIFRGMKFQFNSTNPYAQNGQFNWESRTVFLGFNYRFGDGKNKAKRRRNRDSNEVQNGGFI